MKAFITGGSGFVGRSFLAYITQGLGKGKYEQLVVLSRSDASDDLIRSALDLASLAQVRIVRGDLSDRDLLSRHALGCEHFYHIAAKVDNWGLWSDFLSANVEGTKNALAGATAAGVSRFIHVSTESVHLTGLHNGCLENIDETAPLSLAPPFYAPYTKSKAMAEKLVMEANADGFATVIVRPRFVWGKGDTNILPRILESIKKGTIKWTTPEPVTSTCHVENLCEGMLLAAEKGSPGSAYFLTDGDPVHLRNFVQKLVGENVNLEHVGTFSSTLAWSIAIVLENIPFLGAGRTWDALLSRQVVGMVGQNVILRDSKAREELGYTAHVSVEEGLRALHSVG